MGWERDGKRYMAHQLGWTGWITIVCSVSALFYQFIVISYTMPCWISLSFMESRPGTKGQG
jgi:hypothetical protein